MPSTNNINVNSGDNLVLVGTMKGAFVFRSDGSRQKWDEAGPYFPGRSVYAMAYDGRNGRKRLWAAVNSSFWGSFLSSSNDFGENWSDPERYNIKFPEGSEVALKQIWQIAEGHPSAPDTLYCGVEPAALFKSTDAGETWSLDRGLFDHPHRTQWMPGGGGLCLHTILPDPSNDQRLFIAISTGGVYRTDDGGQNWQPRNQGVRAQFLPPDQQYPEWGQCVHKIVSHPSNPQRMFLQKMAARTGSRAIRACAHSSCHQTSNTPSGDSACTKSSVTRRILSECFYRRWRPELAAAQSGRARTVPATRPAIPRVGTVRAQNRQSPVESSANVFTEDGGQNWQPRNQGVRAQFLPPDQQYPEWGQCVHKIVSHPSNPQRMFLQNHWGLYRSDNGGDSWTDIANGVPSDFGFAMEVDPNDPRSAYIIPLESDEFRCTPEGKLRVYRTRNAGESWEALENGLPQENALETVLRDGLSADSLQPAGIYFGTRNGKLFGSKDSGDSWTGILESLPPIVCVKTAMVQ